MNFLAHTALAGDSDALRLGGLLGDFVTSTLEPPPVNLSPEIVQGIRLHRRIDSYLDHHVAFQRSRRRFSARYRRCAGIMTDIFYDHFLARHWLRFYTKPLPAFAKEIYDLLDAHTAVLPVALLRIRQPMRENDWLTSYQDIVSVHTALDRMSARLSRPELLRGGAVELEANYEGFEQDFFEAYTEVQRHVAEWMLQMKNPAEAQPQAQTGGGEQ